MLLLFQNLELLFCNAHCPDFNLIYIGTTFHVHKSILLARNAAVHCLHILCFRGG
jgi:hypothetical protein